MRHMITIVALLTAACAVDPELAPEPLPDAVAVAPPQDTVTVRLAVYDGTAQVDACDVELTVLYGEAYGDPATRCEDLFAVYEVPVDNLPGQVVFIDTLTATVGPPFWLHPDDGPQRLSVQLPK
jgi:hypothetical protein